MGKKTKLYELYHMKYLPYRLLLVQQETHKLELYLHNTQSKTGVILKNKVISMIHLYNNINTKLFLQIHVFASCDVIQFTVKKGI